MPRHCSAPGQVVESKQFTYSGPPADFVDGAQLEVPGHYNCIVSLGSTLTFTDVVVRLGPLRLVDNGFVNHRYANDVLAHYASSSSNHQLTILGTVAGAATISITFGVYVPQEK
jgi:hypothetical protein